MRTTKCHTAPSTFRLGDEITTAMERLQERDGITPSEQARRALTDWLTKKSVLTPKRTRQTARRRS